MTIITVLCVLFGSAFASAKPIRVLMVSPEQSGVFQTGGLAHATKGLSQALNAEGYQTEVLMPYYTEMNTPPVTDTGRKIEADTDWRDGQFHRKSTFSVLKNEDPKSPTLFLKDGDEQRNLFDNRSYGKNKIYAPEPYIGESFGAFDKAAAEYILSEDYDLVILNDWTTGLIATYLKQAKDMGRKVPKVIFTVHNLAYQGLFDKSLADFMGLPDSHYEYSDGYEFYGRISFLKAGIQHSDVVTTVSAQYAKEIQTPRFGAGLDGLLRKKAEQGVLTGILNGIDTSAWNSDLSGKPQGKAELLKEFGLETDADRPLFFTTARLDQQKGFDYLIPAINKTLQTSDAEWVVMGDGRADYVEKAKLLETQYPGRFRYSKFSETREKQLFKYGDTLVQPSVFEPSGLGQMFGKRTAALPLVSAVGGHIDSVRDGETGFLFPIVSAEDGGSPDLNATEGKLVDAIHRVIDVYHDSNRWKAMQTKAMSDDDSWNFRVKERYAPLFNALLHGTVDCRSSLLPRPAGA